MSNRTTRDRAYGGFMRILFKFFIFFMSAGAADPGLNQIPGGEGRCMIRGAELIFLTALDLSQRVLSPIMYPRSTLPDPGLARNSIFRTVIATNTSADWVG